MATEEKLSPQEMGKKRTNRLVETIDRLLNMKATANLQKLLMRIIPADLSRVLEQFPLDEAREVFMQIPDSLHAALVLKELPVFLQQTILSECPPIDVLPILEKLAPDVRADLIALLEPELASRYLGKMDVQMQRDLKSLMQYASDTAGGLMTSQFFALPEATTVTEAIQAVRGLAAYEMVFYLYVVDVDGRLTGVSSLRQLLLADPDATLERMMNKKVVKIRADAPQSEVADVVGRYRLLAVPVVDEAGIMLGLVTVDDVMEVLEQETTDELLKVAGTSSSEIDVISPWRIFRIRLPWMMASFVGGMTCSLIVNYFDHDLTRALILTAFLPLILGLSGSFGTVVATVVSRTVSADSLSARQYFTVAWREARTAVMMGGLYGLLTAAVSWLAFQDMVLTRTVGVAILVNVMLAGLVATGMPGLFKRFGFDPSMAQGPIVVMVLDAVGVTSYFVIATFFQQQAGG
ncbi:MAG: magnesium transporter [Magnetococcales bacterium]|nr:magnesium transporter [Magnetococcales bacterium]